MKITITIDTGDFIPELPRMPNPKEIFHEPEPVIYAPEQWARLREVAKTIMEARPSK